MNCRHLLVSAVALSAMATLIGGSALGQAQSKDQQKCINTLNKDAAKVAATQGKENSSCVKAGTKGTAAANCLTADVKGKVLKATGKTTADETKNDCLGANAPNFGYSSGAAANAAAVAEEIELFLDTYGSPDPSSVISTDKVVGKCQAAVTKNVEKLAKTKFKQYLGCKKNLLKLGAVSAAALESCLSGDPNSIAADPKGKIAKVVTKLGSDITKNCSTVNIESAFGGDCADSTAATLDDCLDEQVECRVCRMINAIDNLAVDCDLFDDGAVNGSCMEMHKCALGGGVSNSYVNIYSAGFPVPIVFDTSGSSIDIGSRDGFATCRVQDFQPINLIGIGFICIQPGGGCDVGQRHCAVGPGPALGVDVASDGLVGTCTSNPACEATCTTHCGGLSSTVLSAGCTGYCTGGSGATACTTDAQCASLGENACNGKDNDAGNADNCQCSCINTAAFGPSDPGDMQCNLGSRLVVESAAPCNGTDILIQVGNTCIPVTTQRAKGRIDDGNYIPGSTVPGAMPGPNANDQTGLPLACATLDTSVTSGLAGAGAVNFFGSTIGDLSVGLKASCL